MGDVTAGTRIALGSLVVILGIAALIGAILQLPAIYLPAGLLSVIGGVTLATAMRRA